MGEIDTNECIFIIYYINKQFIGMIIEDPINTNPNSIRYSCI